MKKIVLIMALMLILGIVFVSGCTQQQNTTVNMSNKSGNDLGQGIGNKSVINNKNMSNLTNKSGSSNSSGVGIKY